MQRYWCSLYVLLPAIVIAGWFLVDDALAFTARRTAAVEIVDRPLTSISPVHSRFGDLRQKDDFAAVAGLVANSSLFFSKNIKIPARNLQDKASGFSDTAINAEYVMQGYGNNNVQLAAFGGEGKNSQVKFKSVDVKATKQGKDGQEANIKLATVVTIPSNINGGRHYLSLQLAAMYE